MANRIALLLVAVGLVIAAAAWYSASSPGPGRQDATPPELVVTAAQSGQGSWVRYLITVRNVGATPFEGDIVLLNRQPEDGDQAPAAQGVPAPRIPTSIPRFPTQAPDAAYQAHVRVDPRSVREIAITAPDRYTSVAVAQGAGGILAAAADVQHSPSVPVAVLSQSDAPGAALQGLRLDDMALQVTEFQSIRSFPATALGLAAFAAVVIDQFDVQALGEAQRSAIRDFVGLGGGLVVAGGPSWRRSLVALPPELSPLHATGSAPTPLQPVAALAGRSTDLVALAATGDLRPGARAVVSAAGGGPLVALTRYGAGTVVDLAYDPAAEAAGSEVARLGWTQAVGQALARSPGAVAGAYTVPGVTTLEALSFPPLPDAALPSPWLVGPLLLLYLVLVAPLNYLFLRRRLHSPGLMWLTAPLVAALFTGGFYWLGTVLQGGLQDEQLQVLKLGPNGAVADVEYHRIVFLHRGDHLIEAAQPALAAPLTFDLSAAAVEGCGDRCSLQLSGLRSGEEHVVPTLLPAVIERGVVYGGVRIIGTSSTGRQPLQLEAHLALVGGRVRGEIVNRGERSVQGLALYTDVNGGMQRTPLSGVVPSGGLVTFDSAPEPFDGSITAPVGGRPPDAATRISRAVGADALGRGGAWLVGFTDPLQSVLRVDGQMPKRTATTAFEMPVDVQQADGTVSSFAIRRLVASVGDRTRGGFTDVYDLELPAGLPGRLDLGYDSFAYHSVEIFNWASATWDGGGFRDDPGHPGRLIRPVSPGELNTGPGGGWNVLRLRVREPRVSWGASLDVLG